MKAVCLGDEWVRNDKIWEVVQFPKGCGNSEVVMRSGKTEILVLIKHLENQHDGWRFKK